MGRAGAQVAASTHTPLVDLDADTMAFLDSVGSGKADGYYMIFSPADNVPLFPQGHHDTTHLNERGARAAAVLVGNALAKLDLPFSKAIHPADPHDAAMTGSPTCW